ARKWIRAFAVVVVIVATAHAPVLLLWPHSILLSSEMLPQTEHVICIPSGIGLPVSARKIPLASHAILVLVSVSCRTIPARSRGVGHAVRQLFSTGTESFPALPASSHPVAGPYPYSLVLPSIFSLRAEMPRHCSNTSARSVPARSQCAETFRKPAS